MYESRLGVPKDEQKSSMSYQKYFQFIIMKLDDEMGEFNLTESKVILAECYMSGYGVEVNYDNALSFI